MLKRLQATEKTENTDRNNNHHHNNHSANEMILYLKNERQRLTGDLRGLEHSNDALRRELTTLKESSAVSRRELLHLEGNEKDRHDAVENLNQKLQVRLWVLAL